MFNNKGTKLFYDYYDLELYGTTVLTRIGIVSNSDRYFYGEYVLPVEEGTDKEDLKFTDEPPFKRVLGDYTFVKGDPYSLEKELMDWLNMFESVELIGDCSWFPIEHTKYRITDISDMFVACGIHPKINRFAFIDRPIEGDKNSLLYNVKVIRACYEKLYRNHEDYLNMM